MIARGGLMKRVFSVLLSLLFVACLFVLPVGASGINLVKKECPECGLSSFPSKSEQVGMFVIYTFECENGHTYTYKFLPGVTDKGGTTRGGGAGRRDPLPGYSSDGVPSVDNTGLLTWQPSWPSDYTKYTYLSPPTYYPITSSRFTDEIALVTHSASGNHLSVLLTPRSGQSSFGFSDIAFKGMTFTAPVSGYYTSQSVRVNAVGRSTEPRSYSRSNNWSYKSVYFNAGDSVYCGSSSTTSYFQVGAWQSPGYQCTYLKADIYTPVFTIQPLKSAVTNQTTITINNNSWTGNIYQDTTNNLTYIYPQYTTINESGDTVTNISNNPIIYNSTTNEYYTYDNATNNYYYITYVTAPDPTATPAPSTTPDPGITPTPTPGGDTGDTSSILDVLVEIRDNMIQGFSDLKATLVQGWADLSANFTLAIENLNLNITNIFNKKFPDQSTPGTVQPSPSPEPVDPILPDTQNYIIPKMNSNTFTDEHGTWVASGSSKYSDVFDFFHAFDRSTSDFWETNVSPSYLQIEIPDPENYYIDGYIMRISKFDNRYPKVWTLQGSDDGETWDDLDTQKAQNLSDKEEHKYTLTLRKAYKYYRLNMSNYASSMCSLSHFNLLGYDAKDVVTPTPSPSPTPDPGTDPTPAPMDKPSNGNTTNFWTFIFGGGSDDGTDKGHKGILWALISLILAIISLLTGLGASVKYLFPFLPSSVITTIHICVIVLFLFAVIKFIRSFL